MSSIESEGVRGAPGERPQPSPTVASQPPSGPGMLWLFTGTTFLSALLLFSVQPMFAKMALPILGGSPSVWAVALCFFQGALLAGYGYAHLLNGRIEPARAGFVHLGVCALALLFLPIAIPSSWGEPPPGEPYLWQLGLFTVALGLPFVAVSANAPLLQAWFSASGHQQARDPYFLYAASNLGSLIALLGYPFVLEPLIGVSTLSRVWTGGFVMLAGAILACVLAIRTREEARVLRHVESSDAPAPAPTWPQKLAWVGLAAVPSGLLTAFTTHVSTDIASAPLIWVIPLALYLLTFVLVFRDRPVLPDWVLQPLHLIAVIVALLQLSQSKVEGAFIGGGLGVVAFFLSAMVAHRALYESRPAARHLTGFYLWMSAGGVIGGLFAALVAPRIFSEVFEYPLLLALSIACRPRMLGFRLGDKEEWLKAWLVAATCMLVLVWFPWVSRQLGWSGQPYGFATWMTVLFAAAVVALSRWPARQLVAALAMFGAIALYDSGVRRGAAERSYFGVYRVFESSDGAFNVLTHGTTLHGAQRIRDDAGTLVNDITPGTYYYPNSPMARSVDLVRTAVEAQGRKGRFGFIGLGTGSLACYAGDSEEWRIFEIDPTIVGIAMNPDKFSFLTSCMPTPDIVIGDARLTIGKEKPESFDLLIVDAFSSDAVPVHLMTAEALRLYASKLKPQGIVVLHISNRYLDLDAVVGATAKLVPELHGIIVSDESADGSYAQSTSTVAVLSKTKEALEPFKSIATTKQLDSGGLRGWTDDYSDVLRPVLRRMK